MNLFIPPSKRATAPGWMWSYGKKRGIRFSPMAGLTVRPIARRRCRLRLFKTMSILAPIELSAGEKLEVLQRLDRYRKWQSLEEKRYCLACGRIIDGRNIQIIGGTRGTGPLRLICSTQGCHSIPMDWVIPNEEVLAR